MSPPSPLMAGAGTSAALGQSGTARSQSGEPSGEPRRAGDQKVIAIQIDAIAPAYEGVERLLDEVQQRAGVNMLMVHCLWFSPEASALELEKNADRGHVRDPHSKLQGGSMGFMHREYYDGTGLDVTAQSPRPGVPDILAAVCEAAKRRGVRVIPIVKDDPPPAMAGHEGMLEFDFDGQRASTSCKNNPFYRKMLAGVMRDLIRTYDIDGIMYMAERQGPFSDTLGLRFRGEHRGLPASRTCFCPYCREKARRLGIDPDRSRHGFEELAKFTALGRAKKQPVDGYLTTLWRLMLRYPELLAWEHLWSQNLREVYQLLHDTIKDARPSVLYGMHVWPNITHNPLLSAEHDFSELGRYHDFIKMSAYSNCGGPRFGSYVESAGQTMFGDLSPEEVLRFHYRVLNYDEAPLSRVRQAGLKQDFVYRQSKRAVDGVRGTKAMVFTGIDIDVPIRPIDMGRSNVEPARTTRADVSHAVKQAFKAGAAGIVISREYSEMRLDNLSGVGDALKELEAQSGKRA